jgi:hypothetical protein
MKVQVKKWATMELDKIAQILDGLSTSINVLSFHGCFCVIGPIEAGHCNSCSLVCSFCMSSHCTSSFMDILCQLCDNYKKSQQNLGQMKELFKRLDAACHGTDGNENISTSQRGEANLEANFLESELPGLSSDHTPVITGNISTSQGGDANFEASFLEFELPGLSSDYTPESYPVITEPAPEDPHMANNQGTNEGKQITLDFSVTAWSTEETQVPNELEEPQMEIEVSDELEETWMREDETMFFEAYLDYLEIQMKEEYEDEWLAE